MAGRNLSLDVVGADFPNKDGGNRRFEILICEEGEAVQLVPEPKNPADPQAVAVFSARAVQIGYLRAERAPWIRGMMVQGRDIRAIFHDKRPWGATIRVNLDGEEPTLPPPAPPPEPRRQAGFAWEDGVDPDPGFWPDEMPSDD